MTQPNWNRKRALLVFEMLPAVKGPLFWVALASLGLLVIPVRFIFVGEFSVNGQPLCQGLRLNYVLAVGYSSIVFLTTLFTLCLCLDRTGAHYLKNNDLLILSRSLSRPIFYLAKIGSVLLPSIVYGSLAILLFWEELYRIAGINLFRVFLLIFPLSLSMSCLVGLYFLIRNFMGNFMIFFLWLLFLPVIYFVNLWRHYGGILRDGESHSSLMGFFPQFGGIHAYSLGLVGDWFIRGDSLFALVNCTAWTVFALGAGLYFFSKRRL